MKTSVIVLLVSFVVFLAGCATPPEEIQTTHVSANQYSHYDCNQVALELRSVGRRVHELYQDLAKEADADGLQMGIGLMLFWPALFWLEGGDDARAAEYSQLKGERLALEDAAVAKSCDPAMIPKFEEPKREEAPLEKDRQTPIG